MSPADAVPAPALASTALPADAAGPRPLSAPLSSFWREHRRPLPTPMLAAYAGIGAVGGWLLVDHRLGLGAAIVGLLVWIPAAANLIRRRALGDLTAAALSVALLAVVAVRDADWVVALCLAAAVAVGAVASTAAHSAAAVLLSGATWAAGCARAVRWTVHGAGTLAGARRAQVLLVVRSVGVTAVLLVVFGALFASADRVFATYLPAIDLDLLPAQVIVAALVAVGTATLALLSIAPPSWGDVAVPKGRPAHLGEWLLPVLALDALVLTFVALQVGGLLGGHQHVLDTVGLSYAEYAREGFAQLVAATALTLVVVAVAARHAPRETDRERLLTRAALAVLCVGTLGVVASALRRMALYIDAFGLTRLRIFVEVVEIALAVVLVLVLIAGVSWRARWLPRAVVYVAGIAVLSLAVLNPDARIAAYNATADLESGVDVRYLQSLSADAVPTIAAFPEPLRSCLLAGTDVRPAQSPAAWNLGRDRAWQAVRPGAGAGESAGPDGAPGSAAACILFAATPGR